MEGLLFCPFSKFERLASFPLSMFKACVETDTKFDPDYYDHHKFRIFGQLLFYTRLLSGNGWLVIHLRGYFYFDVSWASTTEQIRNDQEIFEFLLSSGWFIHCLRNFKKFRKLKNNKF